MIDEYGMESKVPRGMSVKVRLAILTIAMALCFGIILAISSQGLARLSAAVAQINRIQGSFLRSADNLQSQCAAIELFALSHAMKAASGATEVGASSRPPLEAISNAAKSAASGLKGFQDISVPGDVRASVLASFDDYMKTIDGLPDDLDAGKDRLAARVDGVQNAFLLFNNQMSLLLAALRDAGDAAADRTVKLTRRTSLELMAVIVGAVLTCVLLAALMIRSITRPLGGLVAAVRSIGEGDLRTTMGITAGGEIGRIATSVDGLIIDLRSLIGTVKDRLVFLSDTGRSLSSMMAQTGAAVVQINSSIASTGGQLLEQTAAVSEVTAAIEELARSVDALGAMIVTQSSVISQSSAAVEEMIANVESVAVNITTAVDASTALVAEGGEGKTRIDEVGESVAAIVRYSENLGEAAALITKIAQRTNLLAMNAAIEAAHAGDSGKGFAVVADEIRNLAEQSSSQAKDIAADLNRVKAAIGAVRAASMAAVDSFASVLGKSGTLGEEIRAIGASMSEQRAGGRQVLEGLGRIRDFTREIERGSGEMAGGNKSILEQVQRLTNINTTVVRNNEEMTSGTTEINQAIAGTIDLSSRNADLIAELQSAMDKFRI
jgi:methyl-accepting chemotaxis protein